MNKVSDHTAHSVACKEVGLSMAQPSKCTALGKIICIRNKKAPDLQLITGDTISCLYHINEHNYKLKMIVTISPLTSCQDFKTNVQSQCLVAIHHIDLCQQDLFSFLY